MENVVIVGVAIEDKYISAGVVDLVERKVLSNTLRRKRVNPQGSVEDIINKWVECLKEVISTHPFADIRLGIGIPNLMDYDSGIYLDNDPKRYGSLHMQNIKLLLADRLSIRPDNIRIRNEAANFFLGEVFAGTARGYKRSFGLTLGLGLGSARYVNGVVEDANLWKMPFKGFIAEHYLSVRFLTDRFAELSGIEVSDVQEIKSFHPNPFVEEVFKEFAENLGDFIIHIVRLEEPEIVLIGGQMESSYRFFYDIAVNRVRAAGIQTPIMKAILGERAYVIGAAANWDNSEGADAKVV
jgi:glucokinase